MIRFNKFKLKNGLTVITQLDKSTPLVNVNLLYKVGARNENPDLTGFAHLFEHLMFGGTSQVPDYDKVVQMVGGENNAFTNNDFTNFYISLPAPNLETALWLEADRMRNLNINQHSLDVQKAVVIEEFKQRYLNQPYGDIWLLLRPLAYKKHPYQWSTIGKDISHIEQAELKQVREFYDQYYQPQNTILSVTGNFNPDSIRKLIQLYFGAVQNTCEIQNDYCFEEDQSEARSLKVTRDVPYDALYIAFPMSSRFSSDYQVYDLISDILSSGKSSRFQQRLILEKRLFSSVNAFITGDLHPGLFVFTGTLMEGIRMEDAENAIWEEIETIRTEKVDARELRKNIHKMESAISFSRLSSLNNAMNLAYFEMIGNVKEMNAEIKHYKAVRQEDILRVASQSFTKEKSNTLYYFSQNQEKLS